MRATIYAHVRGGMMVVRRRHRSHRKAKDVCGLYKGDTSFQWGVGVRKVCIDRLLTRVTCAFLGTLDPGYTHGNRPHGSSTFSLSPLSPRPSSSTIASVRSSFPSASEWTRGCIHYSSEDLDNPLRAFNV